MQIEIPCGQAMQGLTVPTDQVVGVRLPRPMAPAPDPEATVWRSVADGMARCGIPAKVAARRRTGSAAPTACIAVTDRTRSTPLSLIVPILLDQLNALGVPDKNLCVISGGGMHAPDTEPDLIRTLGRRVLERVQVVTDEPDNDAIMIRMGMSGLGTPVELHRAFADADIKIGVINVNPCMLAGWSGGAKIVVPGVASRRCIYQNHKHFVSTLMELNCASLMGVMPPENLVRADLEECAAISGIDMVVNTVLDSDRRLVDVYSGDHTAAQRAAVARMAPYVETSLPQPVDVLVAGVGDPALEVSLFQGGSRVCGGVDRYLCPGGTLVMVNACDEGIYEGFEHEAYREWMRQMPTPAEIGRLVDAGEIGGEKGCVLFTFSWLLHEKKCRIVIVTDGMTAAELQEIHLGHAPNVQQAVDEALGEYGRGASVGILPYAGLVLPTLPGNR